MLDINVGNAGEQGPQGDQGIPGRRGDSGVALVKLYGKILAYILTAFLMVSTAIISARAVSAMQARDKQMETLKEKVSCLEKTQLTKEDIRSELNTFKLNLIEDGMIIVPSRNRSKNKNE